MKTILSAIKNLKNQLEDFEASAAIEITHSLSAPVIVYVHSREKIQYGEYSGLTTLGYANDLGKTGRRVLMDNLHPDDADFRTRLFEYFDTKQGDAWVGTYQIKAKGNVWHTMLVRSTVHALDEEGNSPELLLNVEVDITHLQSKDNYVEVLDRALWSTVTRREKQIIEHIAKGSRNQEIADSLDISLNTVETHRKNLLRKLGAKNTTSLLHFIAKYRLLEQ